MASSLDQVGVLTKTVQDAQILLQSIAGYDPRDAHCQERDEDMLTRAEQLQESQDMKGIRVALPQEWFTDTLDSNIAQGVDKVVQALQSA